MCRFRPLLLLLAVGCARPEPFRANSEPGLKTADQREVELKQNLREGRSWSEQEQMMNDVKGVLGTAGGADATGPRK